MVSENKIAIICGMEIMWISQPHLLLPTKAIMFPYRSQKKSVWWLRVVIIERIQDQQTVHDGFYVELGKGDTQGAI